MPTIVFLLSISTDLLSLAPDNIYWFLNTSAH